MWDMSLGMFFCEVNLTKILRKLIQLSKSYFFRWCDFEKHKRHSRQLYQEERRRNRD